MNMVVIFEARECETDESSRVVVETGQGSSEFDCIDHARTKMVGCDFTRIQVMEAVQVRSVLS